jgi:hypothetical protein
VTARRPYEAGAGPWVARREGPHPRRAGEQQTTYLHRAAEATGWTSDAAAALRFDTRREAEDALRVARRGRGPVRGIRDTAVRVEQSARPDPRCATCGDRCTWADDAWVCCGCGDEWYPDHGRAYAHPGQQRQDKDTNGETGK